MKLTEIRTDDMHYFLDEDRLTQGETKMWQTHGWQKHGRQKHGWPRLHYYVVDDRINGEYKAWHVNSGKLDCHCIIVESNVVVDFMKHPEEYPTTEEELLYFTLKYGKVNFLSREPYYYPR